MPSSRFWEFEDARGLGAVQVERDDLARLLLLEFVLVRHRLVRRSIDLVTGTLSVLLRSMSPTFWSTSRCFRGQ